MFGTIEGVTTPLNTRKVAERKTAQVRWPFLTTADLSGLRNPVELAQLVQVRAGASSAEANAQVHVWMLGYKKRVTPQAGSLRRFGSHSPTLRSLVSVGARR